jgi:hypothetical protein
MKKIYVLDTPARRPTRVARRASPDASGAGRAIQAFETFVVPYERLRRFVRVGDTRL